MNMHETDEAKVRTAGMMGVSAQQAVEQHSSRDIEETGGKEGRKDGLPSQAEQDRHCLDTHSFVPDLHVSACLQGLLCSEAGGGEQSPAVPK